MANWRLGAKLRDEGIKRGKAHANREFLDRAFEVVEALSFEKGKFTTDDVWERLTDVSTHDNRAMGSVMRRAVGARLITPSEEYRKSVRPASHRRPLQVWYGVGALMKAHSKAVSVD